MSAKESFKRTQYSPGGSCNYSSNFEQITKICTQLWNCVYFHIPKWSQKFFASDCLESNMAASGHFEYVHQSRYVRNLSKMTCNISNLV